MLEVLLGEPLKTDKEVTIDDFTTIAEGLGLTADLGQDFGFTNPAVTLLIYTDKQDNIYIPKEFSVTGNGMKPGDGLSYGCRLGWRTGACCTWFSEGWNVDC